MAALSWVLEATPGDCDGRGFYLSVLWVQGGLGFQSCLLSQGSQFHPLLLSLQRTPSGLETQICASAHLVPRERRAGACWAPSSPRSPRTDSAVGCGDRYVTVTLPASTFP